MVKFIAHRGASFEAPENTIAAIRRAVDLKVDCIEIDVHLTKDRVPVVIHDSTAKRTTNAAKPKKIAEMTLEEVKELNAGLWFDSTFANETIPALDEVLRIQRDQISLMIEIKDDARQEGEAEAVFNSIQANNAASIYAGSFSPRIYKDLLKYPNIQPIAIVEKEEFIQEFTRMEMKNLAIWHKLLDPTLISRLRESGVETIWTFTVDSSKTARFLIFLGIDGIITNNPRKLLKNPGRQP